MNHRKSDLGIPLPIFPDIRPHGLVTRLPFVCACLGHLSWPGKRAARIDRMMTMAIGAVVSLTGVAIAQSADPVVFIQVTAPGNITSGSGFLVSGSGFILTARHVVRDDAGKNLGTVKVSFKTKNNLVPANVFGCSEGADICVLKVSQSDVTAQAIHPVKLSCRELQTSENLKALGWPFGEQNDMDQVAGQVTGGIGALFAYPTTLLALPGMSGGPVYDASGSVVGLVLAGIKDYPTRTFITPLAYARPLLASTTVASCPSGQDITLRLSAEVPKIIQKKYHIAAGQMHGLDGNVSHTESFAVDDGFEFVDVSFDEAICNMCAPDSPRVSEDRSKINFRFTLSGASGYLEGNLTATMRQKKPEEIMFDLTTSLSFSEGAVQRFTIPPEIPPDVKLGPISIVDAGGTEIGSAQIGSAQHPGSTKINNGGYQMQFVKDGNTIVVRKFD